tara:strand:+ start:293 stop:481 length:189 start_codon:yes stop_codon:yes gene_type:complete
MAEVQKQNQEVQEVLVVELVCLMEVHKQVEQAILLQLVLLKVKMEVQEEILEHQEVVGVLEL